MRNLPFAALWMVTMGFFCPFLAAQTDSLAFTFQDAIETSVAANDDNPFDFDTEFGHLQDFAVHPLNVNTASRADFEQLRLLSAAQIESILAYRTQYGRFIALYELQAVLDLAILRKILPFLTIDGALDDFQLARKEWFRRGKHEFYARYERRLERARGYTEGVYRGSPDKLYSRYRYHLGNRLSYGVTLEKDAGETLGVDFYSFHFKMAEINRVFHTIYIGDFSAALAQGLIHSNGFNLGKSALVMSIERNRPALQHYSSANESGFLRGAAVHAKFGARTEGVLFASYRKRDGNLDFTVDSTDGEAVVTALQFSGLHRTESERADKNSVANATVGASVQRHFKRGDVGLNAVFNHFDKPLRPRDEPYNVHAFRGQALFNASLNYTFDYRNAHFFGETAMSHTGGFATLNGILVALGKTLSFNSLQRFFSLNYHSFNAQPFAESSRPQDERGWYLGLEYRPNRAYTFSAYADVWRHRWWRFNVDAPSQGHEFFVKMDFRRRRTEGYLQIRTKTKQQNAERPDSVKVNALANRVRTQVRFQFNHQLSPTVALRNRLEWSFFAEKPLEKPLEKSLVSAQSKGFVVWQDVIWQADNASVLRGAKASARVAFFDTDDYQSAIYAFENDLLYNFSVLPYYRRGTRFYANLGYQLGKKWLFEVRWARTRLTQPWGFGSGFDAIAGNRRTDIKAQVRVQF